MEVQEIITYLEQQFNAFGMAMPNTKEDTKPVRSKVGQIANILAQLCLERFRRFEDTLMIYNGQRYELMHPNMMKSVILGWMIKLGVGPAYQVDCVNAIFNLLLNYPFLEKYNPKRNIIYTRNCVVVLGDGKTESEVHDKGPEWMSNIYIDIDYFALAQCPEWEKFLSTVIDDPNAIMVLQEFLGAMFIDKSDLSVETALFLYGIGSNGKSVICETLGALLGENMTSVGLTQLTGPTGDYYTAKIVGKLLAYNSDESAKDIGGGRFKQLVSKEKLMARPPYREPFETDDWPMFMANINKSIITSDSSEGFWRRNKVIKFCKRFVDDPDESLGELKADKTFKTKMLGELPGILNWILMGRQRLLVHKGVFTRSLDIEAITEEMRMGSTGVYSFLESAAYYSRKKPGIMYDQLKLKAKDLYQEYRQWCSENGYREDKNINRFKNDMEFAGFLYKKSLRCDDGTVTSGYVVYKYTGMVNEVAVDEHEEPINNNDDEFNFWNSTAVGSSYKDELIG